MRKLRYIFITLLLLLVASCTLVGCGKKQDLTPCIVFKTMSVNGTDVYTEVSNAVESFSFVDEVEMVAGAKYIVSFDEYGTETVAAKTIPIEVGNNTVYVIELINDEPARIYTVTIRRKPIYTVSFNTAGGTYVETQHVEEGGIAYEPFVSREGYSFDGWDYDFSTPVTKDIYVNAKWSARIDTNYKIEYYCESLTKNNYELVDTEILTGTTDMYVTAKAKSIEHYTFNAEKSIMSGKVDADGTLVLRQYYSRNSYAASNDHIKNGTITGDGIYVYGETVQLNATPYLGCEFVGWYSGDVLLSSEMSYICTIDRDISARFEVKSEMSGFVFSSTVNTCTILGVVDVNVSEVVIPSYVTDFADSVFDKCSKLKYNEYENAYYLGTAENPHFVLVKGINKQIKSCNVSDRTKYVLSNAFKNCDNLTDIALPNGVVSIGDYVFYDCDNLVNVTLPDTLVSVGRGAFSDCEKLQYNTYDNAYYLGSTDNPYLLLVTGINNSIVSCVINPQTKLIGGSAFHNFYKLESIDIPDSVISIGKSAFYGCDGIFRLDIGKNISYIGYHAFSNCENLYRVVVEEENCTYKTLNGDLYSKDGKILIWYSPLKSTKEFYVPDGVEKILSGAFADCYYLEKIIISRSVKFIESNAISDRELVSVIIPKEVEYIDSYAFGSSYNVTIYCERSTKPETWDEAWCLEGFGDSKLNVVWGYKL